MFWKRELEVKFREGLKSFSAIVLTGPRRAGKTFLLKKILPKSQHVLLEDPDVLMSAKMDPRAFLENLKLPGIIELLEVKFSKTPTPKMVSNIKALIPKIKNEKVEATLIHT